MCVQSGGRGPASMKESGSDGRSHQGSYWLTRIVLLRSIGFIYSVAFAVALEQNRGLIGTRGLEPADKYLERVLASVGESRRWQTTPTLFWLIGFTDTKHDMLAATGLLMSSFVALTGSASMLLMAALWAIYMTWYSFGWESQLLETGFLAIFLCPLLLPQRFPRDLPTPQVCLWGYRWLIFRIMIGAGLIKIRGDQCWRDLTCMNYHYETQPVPNPLSRTLHRAPELWHKVETMGNHIIELVLPFFIFMPRMLRLIGGVAQIFFQAVLISSGNLSFLNWLTMVPAIACFDDASLTWLFGRRAIGQAAERAKQDRAQGWRGMLRLRSCLHLALLGLISWLSRPVVLNLLSSRQAMNTSYDVLRIVNTYGAFGSITKKRMEVILLGTNDTAIGPNTVWREYEFKCKPGSVHRRPCLISPYHYRLDWLLWFAGFGSYQHQPWLVHLVVKLLKGEDVVSRLLALDPFEGRDPPRYIKADHYRYRYAKPGGKLWWRRKRVAEYLPPLSLDNPSVREFCRAQGWDT